MRPTIPLVSLGFIALLAVNPAAAALSGFYDSGEQIAALLASAEAGEALSQLPVRGLQFREVTEDGHPVWGISTDSCELSVELLPQLPEAVGKTTYKVHHISACE
ncbi:hypothetical protein [Pseudogemmobacter faecipullorum]|uniref:Uncharacterized protein n=1 Tax=Pseudogemmobacter faecipullorum TaxID=2755041 RepID=A0ABS8CLH1_9RHOB|nr:hypothetical protein [Pseudogemmobacter faecipullorum]MCB5410242.1 hypothetical protein [Pseudogemmobacter faecipullorum]